MTSSMDYSKMRHVKLIPFDFLAEAGEVDAISRFWEGFGPT